MFRFASIAATVALLSAGPAVYAGSSSAEAVASSTIFNFGRIDDAYYRGGELKRADDAVTLAGLGVKTVIDLRSDEDLDPDEQGFVAAEHMKYVRIPMNTRIAPTPSQVAQFLDIVRNPANQPVYVHCVEGRHRTGVMTAVYRMTVAGWKADQAFKEMKQFKFGMDFLHPEFKKFVYAFRPAPAAASVAAEAAPVLTTASPAPAGTN